MKWILPILFILVYFTSNGQSQAHFYCLTEKETVEFATKIKRIQDSIEWQRKFIYWQADVISEKDKLIEPLKKRIIESDILIQNDQMTINGLKEENKKLQEIIGYLRPKWYDNKWLWFGGGAVVVTTIVMVLK